MDYPQVIYYDSGSLAESTSYNVAESDISDNSALLFNVNDLPTGDSVKFTIYFTVKMDAISYQDGGDVFRNDFTFSMWWDYIEWRKWFI